MSTRVIVGLRKVKLRVLGLLLFPALCASVAAAPAPEPIVNADTAAKLAEVHASVKDDMQSGGRYEFITSDNREQVEGLFRDMGVMLEKGPVASMSEADRLKLFNLQEKLNGILTGSDSNRQVCEKSAPTGSLIAVKRCRTYGEIQRQRHENDRFLEETKRQQVQLKRGN